MRVSIWKKKLLSTEWTRMESTSPSSQIIFKIPPWLVLFFQSSFYLRWPRAAPPKEQCQKYYFILACIALHTRHYSRVPDARSTRNDREKKRRFNLSNSHAKSPDLIHSPIQRRTNEMEKMWFTKANFSACTLIACKIHLSVRREKKRKYREWAGEEENYIFWIPCTVVTDACVAANGFWLIVTMTQISHFSHNF